MLQSAFVPHASHRPTTQRFAAPVQSASVAQSTHPRFAAHP